MNIIIYTSSGSKSGGSRQALYLAQGLAEHGHNVTFFTPDHSSLRALAPGWECWGDLGPKHMWRNNIEAAMPTDGEPCIVHAFHNAAVKRAAWWGLFWRKRAVVVAHRGVVFRPNNPLPYWSPGIDAFLVNSQACGKILRSMGVGEKRLMVVPNCVPDSRIFIRTPREGTRARLGFSSHDTVFGSVASNSPVKGVAVLLQAFALAFGPAARNNARAKLLLIGVDVEMWQPLCAERGIVEQVVLIDHTEDVATLLGAMDIFVLPSLSESMPNTLLEAVRMGLPCIGTAVGGVPEILETCGRVAPPGDAAELGAIMQDMLQHPEATALLGKKAGKHGDAYAPEVRLTLVEGIYHRLWARKFPQ